MAFDFVSAKSAARRSVMTTLGVPALYLNHSAIDPEADPQDITARYHSRIDRFGDDANQGLAEVILGIDRIILIPSDYIGREGKDDIVFVRNDMIRFPKYMTLTFRLDSKEPPTGPLEECWLVRLV